MRACGESGTETAWGRRLKGWVHIACHAATDVPDPSASRLVPAGYPHVIGTLWPIIDHIGS